MSILPRETGGGIFGQGMFSIDPSASPDQIARKREMIAALMPRFGQARYVGEGLGQLATGVAFGKMNRNLDKAEGAGRKSAAERFQQLLGGGTAQPGGFSILGAAPYTPADPASPQGIADDTMAALGKGPVGYDFVVDGLVARGMPEHIAHGFAMNAADESGFNPQAVGDNGNAYGLAQWNGPRKRALIQFAEAQGKNPGDANVQLDFLAHEVQGPESAAYSKIAATSDPRSAAAAVLNYFERPAETHRARREAAYLGGQAPSGGQGAPMEALYAAAADPWLDQGQRAIIMSMIQTRQQESDPLRQMQLQKGQLELEQMRNPPAPEELITRRALAAEAGLQPGTPEYQTYMATGDLPKGETPTGLMREYDMAVSQGYTGTIQQYQIDLKRAGASNTTVNMGNGAPELGKLSTDFGYVLNPETGMPVIDPETGLPKAAPVPGSPAAMEQAQAQTKRGLAAGNAATASDVVTTAAERARMAAGNRAFGGLGQGLVAAINPYSDSAEVARQTEVLKSNAKVENLNAMRQASPTGGALGGVTEKETDMLASKAGALDPNSPNFERDLADYTRTMLRVIHGNDAGDALFQQTWKGQMGGQLTPAQTGQPVQIGGDDEYNALPSGAQFIGPDGKLRRKP